jgi:hypothetical protein
MRTIQLIGCAAWALALGCSSPPSASTGNDQNATAAPSSQGFLSEDEPGGLSYSGPDEFLRVGEQVSVEIPFFTFAGEFNVSAATPADAPQLSARAVLRCDGANPSNLDRPMPFVPSTGFSPFNAEAALVLPAGCTHLSVDVVGKNGDKEQSLVDPSGQGFPVFGGHLPDKTTLFDTLGAQLRTRTIEGGNPIAGHKVTVSFTDFRADQTIDLSSKNRVIGTIFTNKDHDQTQPVNGVVKYAISAFVSTDGVNFREVAMPRNHFPPVLQIHSDTTNRDSYEVTLDLPAGSKQLQLAFHVVATLVADYTQPEFVSVVFAQKFFAQGAEMPLAEGFDNLDHVPGRNYVVTLDAQ